MTADVAVALNNDVLTCETSQPSTSTSVNKSKQKPPPEYCVLLVGTHHKQPLFEKLLSSADKFERHIQYQDTVYLYVNIEGEPAVVELNDPGIEHTGAREMAVRKAEAIILCYAAYNAASFHQLISIAEDFKSRKNGPPPVLLICNKDEIIEEDEEDHVGATNSSTSEGYESFEEHENVSASSTHRSQRRRSMENIRKSHEEHCPITSEQGKDMAQLFGPECEFLSLSFSNFQGTPQLLDRLITRIRAKRPEKERGRQKERNQPILKITRRRSIPHPLKFLSHNVGEEKNSPNKSSKSKKMDKVSQQEHSSSSSKESIEKEDNSGFLGQISSPPRRSKSVNTHKPHSEEHDTNLPQGEGVSRGTAKSKINKKASGFTGNTADDPEFHFNSTSSPTSMYQRRSSISPRNLHSEKEYGTNSHSSTTPTSLSLDTWMVVQENEEKIQEAQSKNSVEAQGQQKDSKNTHSDLAETKSLETGGKKKNWSFRKLGKGNGEKSATCVIS